MTRELCYRESVEIGILPWKTSHLLIETNTHKKDSKSSLSQHQSTTDNKYFNEFQIMRIYWVTEESDSEVCDVIQHTRSLHIKWRLHRSGGIKRESRGDSETETRLMQCKKVLISLRDSTQLYCERDEKSEYKNKTKYFNTCRGITLGMWSSKIDVLIPYMPHIHIAMSMENVVKTNEKFVFCFSSLRLLCRIFHHTIEAIN